MRLQDQLVLNTQKALDDICRAALAVPEDKREWSPGGAARSTLSQMQEIALAVNWLIPFAKGETVGRHDRVAMQRAAAELATIEACVEAARQNVSDWCNVIADFPDERLDEEVTLPFGSGMTMSLADVLGLPAWNMTYHLGQINLIQLLLGDKEMH